MFCNPAARNRELSLILADPILPYFINDNMPTTITLSMLHLLSKHKTMLVKQNRMS